MTQFKSILLILLGLTLALCGIAHSISAYPGPIVFDRLMSSLPTLTAVLAFAIGVGVSAGGVILLVVGSRAIRRRSQARHALPPRRPVPIAEPEPYDPSGYDARRYGRHSRNGTGDGEDEYEWAGAYR